MAFPADEGGSSGSDRPPGGVFEINGVWFDGSGNPIEASKYTEKYFAGGPDGPGIYQVGPDGYPTGPNLKPDKPSGGGSGTIQYGEPYYDENLRAWVQEDSRGNVSILSRDSGGSASGESYPGSGVNSQGVSIYAIPSSKSPTGYALASGQIVAANGSAKGFEGQTIWDYEEDGGDGAPKLYSGNKVWNPATGKFETAPGYETSGSSSSSLGGFSSGGSSGGFNYAAAAASQAAQEVTNAEKVALAKSLAEVDIQKRAQILALERQFDNSGQVSGDTTANLAQRDKEFQASHALSLARFELDKDNLRRQLINDYVEAIRSPDVLAWVGLLQAHGGNFQEILNSGESAVSPRSLAAAAALLKQIQGNPSSVPGSGLAGMASQGGLGQMGNAATGGEGDIVPPGSAEAAGAVDVTPGRPTLAGNWQLDENGWFQVGTMKKIRKPFVAGEVDGPTDWAQMELPTHQGSGIGARGTWINTSGDNWMNERTGQTATSAEERDRLITNANLNMTGAFHDVYNPTGDTLGLQPSGVGGIGSYVGATVGTNPKTGQYGGTSYQNVLPGGYGYQTPGTAVNPELEQQIQSTPGGPPLGSSLPTSLTDEQIARDYPGNPVPGLDRGGPVNAGVAVVGEGGGEKPLGSAEILVDPTRDAQVVPTTSKMAQWLMQRGMPGYDLGTPELAAPPPAYPAPQAVAPGGIAPQPVAGLPTTTAPIQQATPAGSVTTTSPVAAAAPSPSPTTATSPGSVLTAPAAGSGLSGIGAVTTNAQGGTPPSPAAADAFNPMPQTISPEDQKLMDDIALLKANTPNPVPNANIFDVDYFNDIKFGPSQRAAFEAWLQSAQGFVADDVRAKANAFRLRGSNRGAMLQGV